MLYRARVARRDEILAFLDELLDARSFEDYGPNGMQVAGREEVAVVATGVSAQRELFERAAADGADLVLCHHGLFWGDGPMVVGPQLKARLAALFAADMTLAAYHLPLDAHPEVGNNALICAGLGLERGEPFGAAKGRSIGFVGHTTAPLPATELLTRCGELFEREPLVFDAGPAEVRRIAVVSGGGARYVGDAVAAGVDALITGEPSEPAMAESREGGIHFIAAGHYATENFGVRRLG